MQIVLKRTHSYSNLSKSKMLSLIWLKYCCSVKINQIECIKESSISQRCIHSLTSSVVPEWNESWIIKWTCIL